MQRKMWRKSSDSRTVQPLQKSTEKVFPDTWDPAFPVLYNFYVFNKTILLKSFKVPWSMLNTSKMMLIIKEYYNSKKQELFLGRNIFKFHMCCRSWKQIFQTWNRAVLSLKILIYIWKSVKISFPIPVDWMNQWYLKY